MGYMLAAMKSEDEIISCAKSFAAERGWPWIGRVEITPPSPANNQQWTIRTNCDAIGCNINMTIDSVNGHICESSYCSR